MIVKNADVSACSNLSQLKEYASEWAGMISQSHKQRSLHQISTKRIQFKIFISRTSKTYICDGPKSRRGLKLIKSMERSLSKKYHQKESLLSLINIELMWRKHMGMFLIRMENRHHNSYIVIIVLNILSLGEKT